MENPIPSSNPLNTGNGVAAGTPSASPQAPANITPGVVKPVTATPPASATQSPLEKIMAIKKYIIIGVGVIALAISIYMAYSYYTGISSAVDEVKQGAQELNNKLSSPSSSTTNTTTDQKKPDTNPPTMTIDLSPVSTDTKTDSPTKASDATTDTTNKAVPR